MAQKLTDLVSRSLGANTALVLITTFGSHHSVMVANASTRRLIGTVSRGFNGDRWQYRLTDAYGEIVTQHCSLDHVVDVLKTQRGYVAGKNRNYSRPVYKTQEA